MYNQIKDLINNEFDNVIIDKDFAKRVKEFVNYWWYKKIDDTDHSEFLGSTMVGVNKIIFSRDDNVKFFKYLVDKDEGELEYLYKRLPDINPAFKVHSNPYYLTCVILMHMTYKSNKLNKHETEDLIRDLYYLFSFKVMSSILNHNFKYKPNPAIVKMVYERMSNKYLIKKCGSWANVIEFKSSEVLPGGIHYRSLINFKTTDATYVVQQIVGGYKSMIKNIFALLVEVTNRREGIANTSMLVSDEDGTEKSIEMVFNHGSYVNFCKSIINSYADFYKDDYIDLITKFLPNIDHIKFQNIISALTEEPYPIKKEHDYVEKIMISSFNYLTTKGITSNYQSQGNIIKALKYLKGYWSSGKIKEPMAREAKELVGKLVVTILSGGNKNTIPPLTIGLCLYIYLRSIILK